MTADAGWTLRAGGYRLDLVAAGGAVTQFDFDGEPLFRPGDGPSPFDRASFPLVPFSNRVAHGRFGWQGEMVALAPNFPGSDHPHPLHGFGWSADWQRDEMTDLSCMLRHEGGGDAWPWRYRATQRFALDMDGLTHSLSVENQSDRPMPAGLGFHPYLPRNSRTLLHGLHRGEWHTDAEGIPTRLVERAVPADWWAGRPVAARAVDTAYTDRHGPLTVMWPDRDLTLTIEPSPDLRHTVIYAPAGADFFCVEPVSHRTDALNGDPAEMASIAPGAAWTCSVRFSARRG